MAFSPYGAIVGSGFGLIDIVDAVAAAAVAVAAFAFYDCVFVSFIGLYRFV